MPQLVIFDTDVLIDAGRRIDDAISCLQRAEQKATLGVSIITQMELMVGCRNKSEFRALRKARQKNSYGNTWSAHFSSCTSNDTANALYTGSCNPRRKNTACGSFMNG
ncbi:MAG: hypothetical protein U9Q89_05930 [Thermodesulfobacteriota bacterium]|nr:hypothetical protein [Thermodesulfobacteriota bacterium]